MRRTESTAIFTMLLAAVAIGAAGCAEPAPARPPEPATEPEADATLARVDLDALRSATERYRDVQNALADGYIGDPTNMCITPEMEGQPTQLGAMGIHYFRPDLLGITATSPRVAGTGTHTDFETPGVLIYEPQADGSLELVAIENLVFQAGWTAEGRTGWPEYAGNQFYPMVDNPETPYDEAHGFAPHYELHLWLYRDNPNGAFTPFNPRATCENHRPATGAAN